MDMNGELKCCAARSVARVCAERGVAQTTVRKAFCISAGAHKVSSRHRFAGVYVILMICMNQYLRGGMGSKTSVWCVVHAIWPRTIISIVFFIRQQRVLGARCLLRMGIVTSGTMREF